MKSILIFIKNYAQRMLYFMLFLGLMLATDLVYVIYPQEQITQHDFKIALLQSIACCLVISFFYRRYRKQLQVSNPNHFHRQAINKKFVYFMFCMALCCGVVSYIFDDILHVGTPENQRLIEEMFRQTPISMTITTVLMAPILEELLFRGIFANYFFNRSHLFWNILAIISSSLLFALMHEFALSVALFYYMSIGAIFGVTYFYTRDIRYSIFLHIMMNSIAVIMIWAGV
ncbi:CPBP family intramembrane glutamic endopeptidase [Acinetobacter larvae]|uniref:CPBP family intramembrane glutamic endopeptidase n=1 Tax=Acinetobacter larvae TaxID=1789224 RepID=UPI0012FDD582|nr:CPBP family intramembrane glutamic endopeptidase [Acinetobacter larvae]